VTTLAAEHAPAPTRIPVLLLYGSLAAQITEFALYSTAHLPRVVNAFQFVAIAATLTGWHRLSRATRCSTARRSLDERERALRDRAGWLSFRIMGSAIALLTGGYVLLYDGIGHLPAPTPAALSLLAYSAWIVTWTLPSAVLAWTQPAPLPDAD
jgi:hypothetical protein